MKTNLNIPKQTFNYKQKHLKYQRKKKVKKINTSFVIISLIIIFISSCYLTKKIYVYNNSKDLQFAVEYNFTNGYTSKNKLLRVQYITFISNDGTNAVVEVSGLTKDAPHKNTKLKAQFKKNKNQIWYLDKIID